MKHFALFAIMAVSILSCSKKEITEPLQKKAYYVRVQAAGSEIYYSNVATYAQANGGQEAENSLSKILYAGYSGGFYMLKITNKQSCGIDFKVSWLGKDTAIFVPALTESLFYLPGAALGGRKIKAAPLYKCGSSGGDLGWLEIETPIALPVRFTSMHVEPVPGDKHLLNVFFTIADWDETTNVFNIQLSLDGKNYKQVKTIPVDKVQPNKTYHTTINI